MPMIPSREARAAGRGEVGQYHLSPPAGVPSRRDDRSASSCAQRARSICAGGATASVMHGALEVAATAEGFSRPRKTTQRVSPARRSGTPHRTGAPICVFSAFETCGRFRLPTGNAVRHLVAASRAGAGPVGILLFGWRGSVGHAPHDAFGSAPARTATGHLQSPGTGLRGCGAVPDVPDGRADCDGTAPVSAPHRHPIATGLSRGDHLRLARRRPKHGDRP